MAGPTDLIASDPATRWIAQGGAAGSPLRFVEALCDSAATRLERAARLIEAGQHAAAADALRPVAEIVAELQASLDHDAGAELARDLDQVYGRCRERISAAHLAADPEAARDAARWLKALRDAWTDARRQLENRR